MTRHFWTRLSFAAVLAAAFLPATAGAQSLADVARREDARRKQQGKAVKVYTNDSLAPATPGTLTPAAPVPAAATAAATPAPASTEPTRPATDARPEPEKGEKYWKERIGAARAELERSKTFAAALESRIGSLTLDFVNRDDPGQRAVIEQNRQKSVAELERVQRDIAAQTKVVTGIEEEGRKAGVPAGWLR
jgi:hypothetical protein